MEDLVLRLRKRAGIRRQIPTRKSVQNGEPDRIADLLDEAASEIEGLRGKLVDAQESLGFYGAGIPFVEKLYRRIFKKKL